MTIEPSGLSKKPPTLFNLRSSSNIKNCEEGLNSKSSILSKQDSNKSIDFNNTILSKLEKDTSMMQKLKESKMFKVGELSRVSNRQSHRSSKRASGRYFQQAMKT